MNHRSALDTVKGQGVQRYEARALMEPARVAARHLVDEGEVEITQRGHPVAPGKARGPIRIRRAR
ncbi:DUF3253 domain-containing protein [Streptomyces sp. SJL17-4]|uniref:DUF3253 domain-containing protein n=1 Tax=Streptomyces sp. SJL17-4 TaxID=2967224 RepID=UPI0030CC46AB